MNVSQAGELLHQFVYTTACVRTRHLWGGASKRRLLQGEILYSQTPIWQRLLDLQVRPGQKMPSISPSTPYREYFYLPELLH